jgi:hypothetical protein
MATQRRMRMGNKGLTAKINLWPVTENFDAKKARLWIRGLLTRADGERKFFRDSAELLTTLGEWNVEKLAEMKGLGSKAPSTDTTRK